MQLIIDQSLTAGFIPINTGQQRASLPFKPGVLERKVYDNDGIIFFIIFFSVLTFAKTSCYNVLQPAPLCSTGCNTLSHSGFQMLIHGKECFILLFYR